MTSEHQSRRFQLGDGRVLVVRPVAPDDVEGLQGLYYDLTVDDLHSRFFSAFRPDREFCEKITQVVGRGGWGLEADVIVVAHDPDHEPWHTLVERRPQLHPGVPVCVETLVTPSDRHAVGDDRQAVTPVDRIAHRQASNRCNQPSD